MEDLVGIGVADPADGTRIGEGALERMVSLAKDGLKLIERRREQLEAPPVLRAEGISAAKHREPCAALRARLGEQQRSVREIEGRQRRLSRELHAERLPVEAPGDHQMENEPQFVIEPDGDALS